MRRSNLHTGEEIASDRGERPAFTTTDSRDMNSAGVVELLDRQEERLLNAYIHVTYACNLTCDHCYAASGPQRAGQFMQVESVTCLVGETAQFGFHKAIITGGEPLAHPQREALLERLGDARPTVKPMEIVLRTNLAMSLPPGLLEKIAHSASQIVVSVDGDEATHDGRRGAGTYAQTLANLRALIGLKDPAEISLAAALNASQVGAAEGEELRRLGESLGIDVRFKPVLPLGRAAGGALAPEFYSSLDEERLELVARAPLRRTCGLGMNLYIDPAGECYPCYALTGASHHLGNVLNDGLATVLGGNDVYRQVSVDSNQKCRGCGLRYLCGGFCRAWSSGENPDAPPTDCTALYERAQVMLSSALETLEVDLDRWRAAGLPIA